jgi:hypothetical protein
MNSIRNYYQNNPFTFILGVAILLRLLASIFAAGYLMHDDHFLIIETGGSWADGRDALGWLPGTEVSWGEPQGHSLLFPGMNMYFVKLIKLLGISDPKSIMIFIRLFTSVFSVFTVIYGIKLARKLTDEKTSIFIAWVLAILWFLPFLGVRSLVEVVCIPFLIASIYHIVKYERKETTIWVILLVGILLGFAFAFRFQTALFTLGIGIYLILKLKWKESILLTFGFITPVLLTQGLIDYLVWGRAFAEMQAYVDYNATHSADYALTQWWAYPLMLLFLSLTIVNIGWFFGFFRVFKKYLLITLPVFLFLAFHTYFPNRQERFILPVIPLFLMVGIIGWQEFINLKNNKNLFKFNSFGIWMFFILNIPMGLFLDFSYSKKTRVEAAYYMYKQEKEPFTILIENSGGGKVPQYPKFYSQNWDTDEFYLGNPEDYKKLNWWLGLEGKKPVQFVLFYNNKNLDTRIDTVKNYFPNIELDTFIQAGGIDKILHDLNPLNNNYDLYIYKNLDYKK